MSFEPPEGILDIGNATLRVGKLEVAETSGLNQGLQNIIKNDLLVTENTEYSINHHWGLKLPTTWVAEFEVKGHSGKYIDFNFSSIFCNDAIVKVAVLPVPDCA